MKKRGQIAIEFMLLVAMGAIFLLILLIGMLVSYNNSLEERANDELQDLGISIQRQIIAISGVEDGLESNINIPYTASGKSFSILNGNTTYKSYFVIEYGTRQVYYDIPKINGSLIQGDNHIIKYNGTISIY